MFILFCSTRTRKNVKQQKKIHILCGMNCKKVEKSRIDEQTRRSSVAHQLLALLGIIPPTEVTQKLILWLWFYEVGTMHSSTCK